MKTVKYKDKTETNLMTEGDAPTETPAMANLTLQSNGTTKATYNGKTATTFNVQAADIGAAASSHTHTKSQITDFSHTHSALTLQANGTTKVTYNGSAAGTFNVTPAAIGAAASSHTHTKSQITDFSHTHSEYKLKGDFAILTGSVISVVGNNSGGVNINYPSGFTQANTVPIAVGCSNNIGDTTTVTRYYMVSAPYAYIQINSSNIRLSIALPNGATSSGNVTTYYKLVLMKI